MLTNKPSEKPSANSKQYSFTLKTATGGMKIPTSVVQGMIVGKSCLSVAALEYAALLPYLVLDFFGPFIVQLIPGLLSILHMFWYVH
jgi:hypothetical protein